MGARMGVESREPHPVVAAPELSLCDQLDHCRMSAGPGPGCHKALFYALQLRGVGSVTPLELLLHLVICRSKGIQLVSLCLPSHRLCCQVAIECHICNTDKSRTHEFQ